MKVYPDKDKAFPNPAIPSLCYIKNVVKNPRIIIGDYTYYDDIDGADRFEEHVYNTPRFSDRHNYGGMTRNRYICKKEENQNGKTI